MPLLSESTPPTIVIAIDGLRASALGTYGQTSYETPAFDEFAAESATYEWCYARTPDVRHFYDRLNLVPDLLLTDAIDEVGSLANRAKRCIAIPGTDSEVPAETIAETAAAETWGRATSELTRFFEGVDADDRPLVWFHTRGLHGPWDAPTQLVEQHRDEEDPEIAPSAIPPEARFDDPASDAACEARFEAGCRYAAQIATLDACLAGALGVLATLFEGRDVRVILIGTRGYSLGEHGGVGRDDRLFSEQQHVPLIVRDGRKTRFTRERKPILLEEALNGLCGDATPPADALRLHAASGARAVRTEDWMLRTPAERDAPPELYVKPDDRWEQNNVASLEEATCDELLDLLATGDSELAGRGASN